MPKLTQAEIKAAADRWASIQKKLGRAEAAKNSDLAEHRARFEASVAEVTAMHDPKIDRLREQAAEIESEVIAWLDKQGKPVVFNGEHAIAAVERKLGNRVIDPRKFYEAAKEKFWDCVTVGVKKAEEAIGKQKVDEISDKAVTLVASLTLK